MHSLRLTGGAVTKVAFVLVAPPPPHDAMLTAGRGMPPTVCNALMPSLQYSGRHRLSLNETLCD